MAEQLTTIPYGNDPYANIGSGLGGLISRLLGQNKMTGGAEIDPKTGRVTYTPMQGSTGLFGGQSRRQADAYNERVLPELFRNQTQLDAERLRNEGNLAQEQERGRSGVAQEAERNKGSLATTKITAGSQQEVERIRQKALADAEEARAKHEKEKADIDAYYAGKAKEAEAKLYQSKAIIDAAKAQGMTEQEYVAKIMPGVVQNAAFFEEMKSKAQKADGAQEAVNKNFISQQQITDSSNREKLKANVPAGGISWIPGELGKGTGTSVIGSLQNQEESIDPLTEMTKFHTKMIPGSVSVPIDPAIKAKHLTSPPAYEAPPAPDAGPSDFQKMLGSSPLATTPSVGFGDAAPQFQGLDLSSGIAPAPAAQSDQLLDDPLFKSRSSVTPPVSPMVTPPVTTTPKIQNSMGPSLGMRKVTGEEFGLGNPNAGATLPLETILYLKNLFRNKMGLYPEQGKEPAGFYQYPMQQH